MVFNKKQPKNILFISLTLLVSKLLRLSSVKCPQPENILVIWDTLLVSKLLRSSSVKLMQQSNM